MSEQLRTRLQAATFIVASAITVSGWVWVLAGDRRVAHSTLDQHESRLKAVELDQRQSASAIAEIKTDVRWIRQMMEHRP
jgi:hypothetical protein